MQPIYFAKMLSVVTAVLVLGACASVPVPLDVDLRAQMPEATKEGTVTEPVQAGEVEVLDLRLPTEEGQCVSFADAALGNATVRSAKLQWIVDATYKGPDLTGRLRARAYVAGAGDEVFLPQHTLGPVFSVNLDRSSTRVAGAAVLNPTQLQAVNDREVCWGVEIAGEDVAALEDGTAMVDYSVKQLVLRISFSVL